ncbi:hypothetical protein JHK86_016513 [Glycine max]|nr:hypothetical protein JHK86_016513 [Glycine max]
MESPKTRPKTCTNKFRLFRCFKSEFPDDVVFPPPPPRKAKSVNPPLSYIVVPEKQRTALPRALSSAFAATKGAEENASRRPKKMDKEHNNSLRRALMAALNHTSLAKKMKSCKRKTKQGSYSRESSINLSRITSSSSSSLGFTSSSTTTSSTLSSTTSTNASASSSESYLSRSMAMDGTGVAKNKQIIGEKGYFGSNMALSFLLITSILVLIMWGKCCAIAYTSIGFLVVPNCRKRPIKEGANSYISNMGH